MTTSLGITRISLSCSTVMMRRTVCRHGAGAAEEVAAQAPGHAADQSHQRIRRRGRPLSTPESKALAIA